MMVTIFRGIVQVIFPIHLGPLALNILFEDNIILMQVCCLLSTANEWPARSYTPDGDRKLILFLKNRHPLTSVAAAAGNRSMYLFRSYCLDLHSQFPRDHFPVQHYR